MSWLVWGSGKHLSRLDLMLYGLSKWWTPFRLVLKSKQKETSRLKHPYFDKSPLFASSARCSTQVCTRRRRPAGCGHNRELKELPPRARLGRELARWKALKSGCLFGELTTWIFWQEKCKELPVNQGVFCIDGTLLVVELNGNRKEPTTSIF